MPRVLRPWNETLLVFTGGLALALALPRPGLCFLAWVALIPLLRASARSAVVVGALSRAGFLGAVFGLAFCGLTLHWIYDTCRYAGLSAFVGVLAWSALCAGMSASWALFAVAAFRSRSSLPGWAWPWACAAIWSAIEFAGARWTPGLGLVALSYTQWRHLSLIQAAALFGPHALSFLIMLWNASLASWILARNRWRPVAASAVLIAAWWGYGAWVLRSAPDPGPARRVAILQPNIDQYAKWDERYADSVRGVLSALAAAASGRSSAAPPALVVWPESSVPGWLDDPVNWNWILSSVRSDPKSLASGSYHLVGALTREGRLQHNSAVLTSPSGRVEGVYHKRRLVPFGEFVPFRFLDRFIGLLAEMGDLDPGPARQPLLATPLGPVGVTVCYEAMFPRLSRGQAAVGARILVNLTNDGWYKETWGPYQHFYANRFRAVENRAFVIRAANTGISGIFDPYGRLLESLPLERRGVLFGDIPARDPFPDRSPYARRGDWFGWANLALSVFLLGAPPLHSEKVG